MRGQSAHWKIKGAIFRETVQTAPAYRLYSIDNRYPAMLRDDALRLGRAPTDDEAEQFLLRASNDQRAEVLRRLNTLADEGDGTLRQRAALTGLRRRLGEIHSRMQRAGR